MTTAARSHKIICDVCKERKDQKGFKSYLLHPFFGMTIKRSWACPSCQTIEALRK